MRDFFFFSSRRRHTRFKCDWSSDVCSSDLARLIKTHFGVCGETVTAMVQERTRDGIELLQESEIDDSEVAQLAPEASVVKLVNEILVEAGNKRVSNLQVAPHLRGFLLNYCID